MQRVGELPKEQPLVFVCRSGSRSLVACEQLNRLGFNNVKNFRGGMIAWKRARLPTL
jgi:rhodanese-related sulfurtransferase